MRLKLRLVIVATAAVIGTSACEETPELEAQAPRVAQISCDGGGAKALTPRVQPQQDGIHIRVENKSDARQFYIRTASDEGQNHGGRLRKGETEDIRTTMPPGEIWIGCVESSGDILYSDPSEEFAAVTVVDPDGLWITPNLDCEEEDGGRFVDGEVTGVAAAPEDVGAVIRSEVPGVEPDDELVKPGYPGTQWHGELRHVIRNGEAVASVNVHQQRSRWEVSVRRCQGVPIGS
jgi:hypothetical protein